MQRADLRSSVCGQPRLDQPVFLDREAVADQHLAQDVIGTVDLEADGFEPGLAGVSEPTLDDVGDPVGSCVGHDDRVERDPVAPVGCDHCGFRATEVIEPEELREVVGRAGVSPPPLQIGGLVQPCSGVSAADPLQQHRHAVQVVETDPMLFSQSAHLRTYGVDALDDTWSSAVKRGSGSPATFGRPVRRPLRELIASLANTFRRCHSTVRALMNSWLPISGLEGHRGRAPRSESLPR